LATSPNRLNLQTVLSHYYNLIHLFSNAIKIINKYIDNTIIVFIILARKRNDNILSVKLIKSNEVKDENYYRRERAYGKFQRTFSLPADVDSDKIKADFADGLLKIEVPKPEKQKPKNITIH